MKGVVILMIKQEVSSHRVHEPFWWSPAIVVLILFIFIKIADTVLFLHETFTNSVRSHIREVHVMTIAQAEGADEIGDFFKDGQLFWLNISRIIFVIGRLGSLCFPWTRMNKSKETIRCLFKIVFLFSFSAPL